MRRRRRQGWLGPAVAVVALVGAGRGAAATEPKRPGEPPVLREPGEVTNVFDAFDDENDNPFDIAISLGLRQSWQSGKLLRETSLGGASNPGLTTGGFVSHSMAVAAFKEATTRLDTRIDIGVYHDIAVYARLPIILHDSRSLDDLSGSTSTQNASLLGAYNANGTPEQLFRLPFQSPDRSGIEYLALGVDVGVFNQARDPSKPTWVIGAETRLNVSEPMHACNPNGAGPNLPKVTQVSCAQPSDINRNGAAGDVKASNGASLEGAFSGGRSPGVSRGTTGLEVHTLLSRRMGPLEPYGGLRALVEFANASSDYGATAVDQVLTNHPPLVGTFILGSEVIPYEVKETFQRLTFDARAEIAYHSEGRDYSPLFDALGSSDAPSIRRPNFAAYQAQTTGGTVRSVVDPGSQKVYVTGLTDVGAYATMRLSGSAQFQAGRYVKFQIGAGYTFVQSHFITGEQPCNPNFTDSAAKAGPCTTQNSSGTSRVTGVPNPLYRPAVDISGRRFFVDGVGQVDGWVNAVVMF